MMAPDWGTIGTLGGGFLLFASTVIGIWLKFKVDRQAQVDAAAQKLAEANDARTQRSYDQVQEDLTAARAEVRSLQSDFGTMREQMGVLWDQIGGLRRQLEAAESHIADLHRWADNGAKGPRPTRLEEPR